MAMDRETLEAHLREAFGLRWSWRTRAAYHAITRGLRASFRRTPGILRHVPQATLGELRVLFRREG